MSVAKGSVQLKTPNHQQQQGTISASGSISSSSSMLVSASAGCLSTSSSSLTSIGDSNNNNNNNNNINSSPSTNQNVTLNLKQETCSGETSTSSDHRRLVCEKSPKQTSIDNMVTSSSDTATISISLSAIESAHENRPSSNENETNCEMEKFEQIKQQSADEEARGDNQVAIMESIVAKDSQRISRAILSGDRIEVGDQCQERHLGHGIRAPHDETIHPKRTQCIDLDPARQGAAAADEEDLQFEEGFTEDDGKSHRGSGCSSSEEATSATSHLNEASVMFGGTIRTERSNSCSQAELGAHAAATASIAIETPSATTKDDGLLIEGENVPNNSQQQQQTTSASQENLTRSASSSQLPILASSASVSDLNQDSFNTTNLLQHSSSNLEQREDKLSSTTVAAAIQNLTSNKASSSSSRFFTSKLNTGSLWSLLSVGSNSGTGLDQQEMKSNKLNQNPCGEQEASSQDKGSTSSLAGGFFSRVQSFKRYPDSASLTAVTSNIGNIKKSTDENNNNQFKQPMTPDHHQYNNAPMKRFRFNYVKYIGCTILHKNFTLPMLEWIAKDVKRQSVRGAQSTSQRQFNFPSREIVLEIYSNCLIATSCKDGHLIFKHPMHCISKYAQLQHDQTSFSYLIRDTKETPYYCHVFQTRSANKVHDIFKAIREAASSGDNKLQTSGTPSIASTNSSGLLQKSMSTDNSPKQSDLRRKGSDAMRGVEHGAEQQLVLPASVVVPAASAHRHFEDSYQFEVMFVKKVKVQCRRVPATFVDDALETLKSFEVLKGGVGGKESKTSQIKGSVGKRPLISASVDERQEYDEMCQSPTPCQQSSSSSSAYSSSSSTSSFQSSVRSSKISDHHPMVIQERRGSIESLNKSNSTGDDDERKNKGDNLSPSESRSCQQSPTKSVGLQEDGNNSSSKQSDISDQQSTNDYTIKKHQSMDCLKSIADLTIKTARAGNAPNYTNDFSPYNTISSNDLNERIAAIPVVSTSSVSLDHETRQKLARQVRETIMATAATIKKDIYASGDKLDSSSSSKALDSLSCTAASSIESPASDDFLLDSSILVSNDKAVSSVSNLAASNDQRRSSAGATLLNSSILNNLDQSRTGGIQSSSSSSNFDLFRRACTRQVVKNRTMLLLIGKDELCAISIDKHQVLFSKSFSSIVLCLQGKNNGDHFGLICRDSGKINPQAESYSGFIFKCQSDKVAREIMAALKQVIYNSHHNQYHTISSPYNPANSSRSTNSPIHKTIPAATNQATILKSPSISATGSLAAKRGFLNSIDLDEAAKHSAALESALSTTPPTSRISTSSLVNATNQGACNSPALVTFNSTSTVQPLSKSLIKSMFCDNCPLYWYHRLCCDIESLPDAVCKTLILRRVDNSLAESEQDEIYSKFSEFNIETVEEHNTIFMSLLRHLSERKQLKHAQGSSHIEAMAKNNNLSATLSSMGGNPLGRSSSASMSSHNQQRTSSVSTNLPSTSSIAGFVMNQSSDASATAIDNLKRAKNSISISIENMLKRRSSLKDFDENSSTNANETGGHSNDLKQPLARAGSFKIREQTNNNDESTQSSLKRSQSTTDYSASSSALSSTLALGSTLRGSISRTINNNYPADAGSSIVGLFRRRGSSFGSRDNSTVAETNASVKNLRNSTESLVVGGLSSPANTVAIESPSNISNRFNYPLTSSGSGHQAQESSTSSILSSVFWKKSIFDKVRRQDMPTDETQTGSEASMNVPEKSSDLKGATQSVGKLEKQIPAKKTREELRTLWRKAILEQITLIKMDKQNRKLLANSAECDIQRIKLNYRDVPYRRDVIISWDKLLKKDPNEKMEFVEVARFVRAGVPKQRRGSVWMLLMNQYQLRHGTSFQTSDSEYLGDANQNYRSLLSQLSLQQHEIFVDIGRTFPMHPYYSRYLSIGQLSLFNLLKAYSLLDQQVGYCQGLSFVAGILLLHVDSEDEAFELMRHLLFNFGLRKQYLPSMDALHLQLYQLTRLLRDHEFELFNHFDNYDISPSLYAAPWFLTLFASQFPLGFVSRLLDLIFLIGIEAIFRVSLNLLAWHRQGILNCKSLEATMDYMRSELVKELEEQNLINLFDKSFSLDLRNKLIEYEIEYTFYCAEDKARSVASKKSSSSSKNAHKLGALSSFSPSRQSESNRPNMKRKPKSKENSTDKQSLDRSNSHNQLSTFPICANDVSLETALDKSSSSSSKKVNNDKDDDNLIDDNPNDTSSTSMVADATATVIIQHLLANNHLKSLRSNYSY